MILMNYDSLYERYEAFYNNDPYLRKANLGSDLTKELFFEAVRRHAEYLLNVEGISFEYLDEARDVFVRVFNYDEFMYLLKLVAPEYFN